jgi:hypothetical protein
LSMKTNQSAFKDVFKDKNRTFIYYEWNISK